MSAEHVHLEIERKYLLNGVPEIPKGAEVLRIEQGYMRTNEGNAHIPAGRLRKTTHADGRVSYVHTIKQGEGLIRIEHEREISKDEFERWWPGTDGRRLSKVRHRAGSGQLIWEVDVFDELDVVLVEVELPDAKTEVNMPEWIRARLVREVTDEPAYRNSELAIRAIAERRNRSKGSF